MLIGTIASPAILGAGHRQRREHIARIVDQGIDHVFIADHVSFVNGLGMAFVPVGNTLEIVDLKDGTTLTTLPATAQVTGAAAVARGHVFFGTGLSYYDEPEPGSFYVYSL